MKTAGELLLRRSVQEWNLWRRLASESWPDLIRANLIEANLSGADLSGADLSGANLYKADLIRANLYKADLIRANLSGANLSGANLSGANLIRANLIRANLSGANLSKANLSKANLSGTTGMVSARQWMERIESDAEGWIVYKAFGLHYEPPKSWDIRPGAVIDEVCNPCRVSDCASGVNVATLGWIKANTEDERVWKCRIRWAWGPGVVVPYHSDGKFRTERLELIEEVTL